MHYKVYYQSLAIQLASPEEELQKYGICSNIPSKAVLKGEWNKLLREETGSRLVTWQHPDVPVLWHWFRELFSCRDAAGGLVANSQRELLLIFRRGRWDLPKGHVDPGETIVETALREVMEECGIPRPVLREALPASRHIYREKGENILKTTYWYLMYLNNKPALVPQTEEGIQQARWLAPQELPDIRNNLWDSLKEILDEGLKAMQDQSV